MNVRIKADLRQVTRATNRLRKRTPVVTAQELNRQRTRSRTLIVRKLSRLLGIKPQRRVRQRVLLPRGGRATASNLVSTGLSLVDAFPARWMARRGVLQLTAGAVLRTSPARASKPFFGINTSDRPDMFQRRTTVRLPVSNAMVDVRVPGYRVREEVLRELARDWPNVWQKRMRREIKRIFG